MRQKVNMPPMDDENGGFFLSCGRKGTTNEKGATNAAPFPNILRIG
jgi:hypothetical protein